MGVAVCNGARDSVATSVCLLVTCLDVFLGWLGRRQEKGREEGVGGTEGWKRKGIMMTSDEINDDDDDDSNVGDDSKDNDGVDNVMKRKEGKRGKR